MTCPNEHEGITLRVGPARAARALANPEATASDPCPGLSWHFLGEVAFLVDGTGDQARVLGTKWSRQVSGDRRDGATGVKIAEAVHRVMAVRGLSMAEVRAAVAEPERTYPSRTRATWYRRRGYCWLVSDEDDAVLAVHSRRPVGLAFDHPVLLDQVPEPVQVVGATARLAHQLPHLGIDPAHLAGLVADAAGRARQVGTRIAVPLEGGLELSVDLWGVAWRVDVLES